MGDFCFLDKCSISQTDPLLKLESIRQLGGYIAKSRRFLLCSDAQCAACHLPTASDALHHHITTCATTAAPPSASSRYCSRLWCMYEVAVFATLREDLHGFCFLPLQAPRRTVDRA